MKNLFIIDPLETIIRKMEADSTTLLIESGLKRGHEIYIATLPDLILTAEFFKIRARKVLSFDLINGYKLADSEDYFAHEFKVIWLRKNPPFDETYLMHLGVLDRLMGGEVFFVNNPNSVRALNEKLAILNFPNFIIETLVTMKLEEIFNFWRTHQKIVVKGLTGFGGDSVILIQDWQKDLNKLVKLSNEGRRFLMAQKFIENVYQGDKRITILDGKIIGALLRVPAGGSFIAYTGGGATVHLTNLDQSEKKIAEEVGNFLRKQKIFWAGIDLIDGHLSEVNITSPSLLAAAHREFGLNLDQRIWDKVEDDYSVRTKRAFKE